MIDLSADQNALPWSLFGLLLFLSSCTVQCNIHLRRDGSAQVFQPSVDFDQVTSLSKHNDIITQVSRVGVNGVRFEVGSIDSLGNYLLPPFKKGAIIFEWHLDTLFIHQIDEHVFTEEYENFSHLRLEISSDQSIEYMRLQGRLVHHKKNMVSVMKRGHSSATLMDKMEVMVVFSPD
jgi:hypothetical protein